MPRLRVVVLAAGFSSRLGKPKALVRINGVSLLRSTLKRVALLRAAETIAVVPQRAARYRNEARGIAVTFAVNARRESGLSSSVQCGIAKARFSAAVLLLPVDLVNLRRDELRKLILRWRGCPRCVVARRLGQNGGTPLILPSWLYPKARDLQGDIGMRELVGRLPHAVMRLVDMPSAVLDVDTKQDLAIARGRRQRRG